MSDDLISRQAAIEAISAQLEEVKRIWGRRVKKGEIAMCLDMRGVIEALPSAQPGIEPKTGHWIEDAKTYYEELKKRSLGVDEYTSYFTDDIVCSECFAKYSVLDNETQFFKHCPNCGAKMEGEAE